TPLVDLPPKPGHEVKEAIAEAADGRVIVKRRTGLVIVVRPGEYFVLGDVTKHEHQVHNVIGNAFASGFLEQGYVMLHASAVSDPSVGMAFGARSGGGKSSLALAMLERGFRFVTNDRLFVRPIDDGVQMLGMPKMPRVNPGTLVRLPSLRSLLDREERRLIATLSHRELWELERKHDVDVDSLYGPGTWVTDVVPLDGLYILHWSLDGDGLEVRTVESVAERFRELRGLLKGLGPYAPRRAHHLSPAGLDAIAARLPVYRVEGRADVVLLSERLAAGVRSPAGSIDGQS
ncbi:MAG TPA: hypothetical protein VNL92_05565, partial [Dehalococcoidia bacterium]|nr:hypothetical protein [Dehalococcoidia bacterium]